MATRPARAATRILGLTGPIACGKSTVGDILLELGAIERIDADAIVHGLMVAGTETTARIREEFGAQVLRADGSIDRAALGQIVFDDPVALRRLEGIVHPAVRQRVRAGLYELSGREGVVVVDAVRLLQSELLELCDAVWVVQCRRKVELDRLMMNRRMARAAAEARLAAQPAFDHPRVTLVIDNSASLEGLRRQVVAGWQDLLG